jgi:dienelactone hydrolase
MKKTIGTGVVLIGMAATLYAATGVSKKMPVVESRPVKNVAEVESRDNLMVVGSRPVKNVADWAERRAHIIANVQAVTGALPDKQKLVPLDVKVLETVTLPKVTRQKITYAVESGDRVPAYLFIPNNLSGKLPAMICLHQTYGKGKEEPAGISGSPNLYYAFELAERGYVTLAPDCPPFGENRSDAYKLGYESVTMKAVWNHMRGIDLLASRLEVDPAAIGSIGHSHGGFNTLMLALFDNRVKVAAVSCGFSSFRDYKGGDLSGWSAQIYYMPKIKTAYGNSSNKVPFDFPEILGALAPRPVFINSAMGDSLFTAQSVDRCVSLANPVYKIFGASQNLVVVHPPGNHDFPAEARMAAYEFIDKTLKSGKSQP